MNITRCICLLLLLYSITGALLVKYPIFSRFVCLHGVKLQRVADRQCPLMVNAVDSTTRGNNGDEFLKYNIVMIGMYGIVWNCMEMHRIVV